MRTKIYYGIMVLNAYSIGILTSVFSLVFLSKGLNLIQVALVMGLYSAAVIILEFPTGVAADAIGRKRTFCLALFANIAAYSCILFGRSLLILCTGALLIGAARALSSGSLEALFIDQYTDCFGKERLSRAITNQSICEGAGLAAGALTGGLFPQLSSRLLPQYGIYNLNIIIKLLLTITIMILAVCFIREKASFNANQRVLFLEKIKTSLLIVCKNRTLILVGISLLAGGFFLSVLETYWQPRFLSLTPNGLTWMLGVLAFLYFTCAMLGNLVSQKILDRTMLDSGRLYFASRSILAAVLFVLALQSKVIPFTFFYSLLYLVFGAANIFENVLVNREIPNQYRSSILSFNSLILQMGSLGACSLSGLLIDHISIGSLWMIAAAVVMAGATVTLFLRPNVKPTKMIKNDK